MIIGIIPNKNDGWILEANLTIFTKLCDKIIIGLDNCTDDSEKIAQKFDNTILVNNLESGLGVFQENRRQRLLEKARELSKDPVIIAIDADEIFSEEILKSENVEIIKKLDHNTTLEVKFNELWFSPKLYRSEKHSSWAGRRMPCIWRDNGKNYPFNNWHEVRVPDYKKSRLLNVDLIHFARIHQIKYWSRIRYYIARDVFINKKNAIKSNFHYAITHNEENMKLSPIKKEWFPSLDQDFFFNIQKKDDYLNWFNDEVLEYLLEDKKSYLKLADIWDFDWINYYKIKKNKDIDHSIIDKLSDKRTAHEKKISYFIRMNYSYPKYSIYFYINLITIFLMKIKIYSLIRRLYFKIIKNV